MARHVTMVFIDAFSSKYLDSETAPFLFSLYDKGACREIEPLSAFEGIGATAFSGFWPDKHGIWTNFVRRRTVSRSAAQIASQLMLSAGDILPGDRLVYAYRYLLGRLLNKPVEIDNRIPASMVMFFESKMQVSIFQPDALGTFPTLFDTLRENGKAVTFIGHGSDEKICARAIGSLKEARVSDFVYLKFSSLDPIGHKHGPESPTTRERVKRVDAFIGEIAGTLTNEDVLVVFSDHGMAPVTEWVDVLELCRQTGLRVVRDYLFFLDSTLARFWFFNQSAREIITSLLTKLECGFILSDDDLRARKLPVSKEEYGELIFALNEGVAIHPDFFHRNLRMKGMHGYFTPVYDRPVLAVVSRDRVSLTREPIRFVDIAPTVLDLMSISSACACDGRAVIL